MARKIPSEFVPLDVNYAHDRAIRSAGPMAEVLFIRGMAYARRTRSHGHLPDYDLTVFGAGIPSVTKCAATLVREGLWVESDGGWAIRSWIKWNPASTAEVAERQSAGGVKGNHERWHVTGERVSTDCPFCASVTDQSTDQSTDGIPNRSRIAEVEVEVEVEREKNISSEVAVATARPDVDRLCSSLADRIEANGSKRPKITKAWRDSARLLMDTDGRTEDQALRAIEWCQADEFWRGNILSMPKLRAKFDQLRLAATRPERTSDRQGELLRREMAKALEAEARQARQIGAAS